MNRQQSPIVTRKRDRRFNAVFRAIARIDESLTTEDLVETTGYSASAVNRIIAALRDRGRVRSFRDADDGRLIRHEISPGSTEVPTDEHP